MAGKGYEYADDFDDDWYADEDDYYQEEDDGEDPELAAAVQAAKKASLAGKPVQVHVNCRCDHTALGIPKVMKPRTTADGCSRVCHCTKSYSWHCRLHNPQAGLLNPALHRQERVQAARPPSQLHC